MSKLLSFFVTVILLIEAMPVAWTPTMTVDAAKQGNEVSTRATGHLYGLAENGVPSEAMTNSIDISSVSQKVVDGLQHPTGDVDHVKNQLNECDYIVVYLQDAFSTWYYCYDEIMQMRKDGTYDHEKFMKERYFPLVREKVEYLKNQPYADKLVYCIYNECDNAVWFGNYVDGNVHYDETGRANFHKAWKDTYEFVKSIDPDAKIGGPGFCDYEKVKITEFMQYCAQNSCVPEIMIYHELAWWSIPDWQVHVDDYRALEDRLGIEDLPIVVTEYGDMQTCGNPGRMVHFVTNIENSGTYAQMAYWRLANNLNDTAADDNSPNSNWWLFRKYAEMEGRLLETKISSVKDRHLHDGDWFLSYKGLASLNDSEDEIRIIAAGSENKRAIKIKNLDETNLGKRVNVKVECVYFKGLTGIVSEPIVLRQYYANASLGNININIPGTDTDTVYFVTVSPENSSDDIIRNTNIPVRYEFEQGTLLGDAYTYDSAYATTGEIKGMVGGMEKTGDGVKITVNVPCDALYNFDIIYGNANDGKTNSDRDYVKTLFSVDGNEQVLTFPNTIKSEYTDCYTLQLELKKGKHTVEFRNNGGTFVLDSLLVSRYYNSNEISVLKDGEKSYLAVAPYDGYYAVYTDKTVSGTVDKAKAEFSDDTYIYLRRGLNEIELSESAQLSLIKAEQPSGALKFTADDFILNGARVKTDKYGAKYIDGISSEGGSAKIKFNVPESGAYRITVNYANNLEGGYHAYNVDLIEAMMTVSVNGENSQDIFCRNTYSNFTYKTMTFNVRLEKGENEITVYNSGSTKFNSQTSFAPQIESFTVNAVNA